MLEFHLSSWIWLAAGFVNSLKRLMPHQTLSNSGAGTIIMISRLILAFAATYFFFTLVGMPACSVETTKKSSPHRKAAIVHAETVQWIEN